MRSQKRPQKASPEAALQTCFLELDAKALELDPNSLTPVASSFVLTPTIFIGFSISPPPIVAIDLETKFGAVLIFLFYVPAVAFLIANDRGRRACRNQGKNADGSEISWWWCCQTLRWRRRSLKEEAGNGAPVIPALWNAVVA
jgi:hypothetical protein